MKAREKVFVFGSNLAGRHGKGAALTALKKHGAVYGQGCGRQGMSYAIPTKDEKLRTLPLFTIEKHVAASALLQKTRSPTETTGKAVASRAEKILKIPQN